MRFMLRWLANTVAFYLALYLVDSLVAPRFWLNAVWLAVILAVLLGLLNSLVRPLHRVGVKPFRAIVAVVLTILLNALLLQVFIWIGAPLSTTSIIWVLVVAAFLSLLAGVLNWLVGFKKKEKAGSRVRARRPAKRGKRNAKFPRVRT